MNGLWIVIALLSALVLAFLLPPLIRRAPLPPRRGDYDLGVYRDQLKEIGRDQDRGLLNDEQAAAATTEIQRRMLAAAAQEETGHTDGAAPPSAPAIAKTAAAFVAVLVPVGAIALYVAIGAPGVADHPSAQRAAGATAQTGRGPQGGAGDDMDRLVGRLAQRLLQDPGDLENWLLLARSYVTMQRYDDAANAYRRALDLSDGNPDIAADYAEILVTAADGTVTPEAARQFRAAFAANPRNPKARYYLAAARAQEDDFKGAAQAWVDLIAVSRPNAPWLKLVHRRIDEAADKLGIDAATLRPSPEALALAAEIPPAAAPMVRSREPAVAAPGPSRADMEAAAGMSAEERGAMIRSMVARLAARLEENPDDMQGWLRLGRAYQVLGEQEKARRALSRAEALKGK